MAPRVCGELVTRSLTVFTCKCGRRAIKICDFDLIGTKAGQKCDRALCASCAAQHPETETDLCPPHFRMVRARLKKDPKPVVDKPITIFVGEIRR